MSVRTATPIVSEWSDYRMSSQPLTTLGGDQEDIGLGLDFGRIRTSTVERPPSSSHKSFAHSLSGPNFSASHNSTVLGQAVNSSSRDEFSSRLDQDPKPSSNSSQSASNAFGSSAPISPVPQLTPTSAEGDPDEHPDDDDDMIMVPGEEYDETCGNMENGTVEKTAAERRAEKRKMKRFR